MVSSLYEPLPENHASYKAKGQELINFYSCSCVFYFQFSFVTEPFPTLIQSCYPKFLAPTLRKKTFQLMCSHKEPPARSHREPLKAWSGLWTSRALDWKGKSGTDCTTFPPRRISCSTPTLPTWRPPDTSTSWSWPLLSQLLQTPSLQLIPILAAKVIHDRVRFNGAGTVDLQPCSLTL